ncbi:MAG: aconitate hydratase AcnA, partial [Rhodospirillales bacterium]|nr:aconitate hydratase AcnA [Rhodospirillales bacterium]
QMLRKKGVVGKFVEFFGDALPNMTIEDQATIANMAPEYGATCGFFPVDRETIRYLAFTGRDPDRVDLVEAYAKAQGMWWDEDTPDPLFTDTLELNINRVEPCIAGPKRPQDRVALSAAAKSFASVAADTYGKGAELNKRVSVEGENFDIGHGDIMIAAITSCTNTSNPSVMLAAGLIARNAIEKGLRTKPWVKTSLAPGSQVVTDYLARAGLQSSLDALGFNLVGYGCTTCIGNSGPLTPQVSAAIQKGDLVSCSVLSGNRNFEGRISPDAKANYLASPPLVVAYAIAGSMQVDIWKDSLGDDSDGNPVFLKDIWPSNDTVRETLQQAITPDMFRTRYADVFLGTEAWQAIKTASGLTYPWNDNSTYVQNPPYFRDMKPAPSAAKNVSGARILALLGDSITTDHISPAGSIKQDGPAGDYLTDNGVAASDFNSFGSRRGNHEIMMRGTFANIRLRNELAPGTEGGVTRHLPDGAPMSIYDAAMKYADEGVPLVVIAGAEYGTGSSRDWAAKGTRLLGVKAVITESFERIHRSNLVGMGVLPLCFKGNDNRKTLNLTGEEIVDVTGVEAGLIPGMDLTARITYPDGAVREISLLCRIDTEDEVDYYLNGGILQYVLRNLVSA